MTNHPKDLAPMPRGDLLPDRPEQVWATVSGRRLASAGASGAKTRELS